MSRHESAIHRSVQPSRRPPAKPPLRLVRGAAHGLPPSVLTIGTFDGLHVGHAALIARARVRAAQLQAESALLSFEPMPREVLNAGDPPARLTNFRERWRLLEHSGLDRLHLLTFNNALRSKTGEDFMALLRTIGARAIIVGHDFRSGRGGHASAEWCASEARRFGFEAEIVAPVQVDGERVSSGMVRSALAGADLKRAARLLGRPYTMRARVRTARPNARLPDGQSRRCAEAYAAVRSSRCASAAMRCGTAMRRVGRRWRAWALVQPSVGA